MLRKIIVGSYCIIKLATPSFGEEPDKEIDLEVSAIEEFTVINTISVKGISQLEEILAKGKFEPTLEELPDSSSIQLADDVMELPPYYLKVMEQVKISQYLHIFRFIEPEGTRQRVRGVSFGHAYHIGGGFFLTAHHVVESYLSTRTNDGSEYNLMLYNDPNTGIVDHLKILIYSESRDIALGKIEIPDSIDVPITPIMKGMPVSSRFVYTSISDVVDWDGMNNEFLKNGRFVQMKQEDFPQFEINGLLVFYLTRNAANIHIGQYLDSNIIIDKVARGAFASGRKAIGNGEFFWGNESNLQEFGSGSGVLSVETGNLAGILVGATSHSSPEGGPTSYTYRCTGPDVIRDMIRVLNYKSQN